MQRDSEGLLFWPRARFSPVTDILIGLWRVQNSPRYYLTGLPQSSRWAIRERTVASILQMRKLSHRELWWLTSRWPSRKSNQHHHHSAAAPGNRAWPEARSGARRAVTAVCTHTPPMLSCWADGGNRDGENASPAGIKCPAASRDTLWKVGLRTQT